MPNRDPAPSFLIEDAPDDLSAPSVVRPVITTGATFAFLGDSHTAGNGVAPGILASMSQGYAFHSLLPLLTSGRITWLGALGAAGITSRTLTNTYLPQLLRAPILPKNVVILIGGNDGAFPSTSPSRTSRTSRVSSSPAASSRGSARIPRKARQRPPSDAGASSSTPDCVLSRPRTGSSCSTSSTT